MFETTRWGVLKTAPERPIGLDSIQDQVKQKLLRFGLTFNIMIVGSSGLGKSTMMNTLFKSKVNRWMASDTSQEPIIPPTVEIKTISHVIEEKNIRLKLSITDTPGFGDHVNNVKCWEPIIKYINDQYQHYLSEERRIERKPRIPDTRIHCVIYFIAPTGHSLRAIDVECLKRLVKVVNVIPVIAKADSLTLEERQAFKNRIRNDFERNGISKLYPMLHKGLEEDEFQKNKAIKNQLPFAVVGSDQFMSIKGTPVLARKTRWGTIEVENPSHNEFPQFRDMLLRTHLHDLIDTTAEVYYEHYRRNQLQLVQDGDS
ncbi:uncharacterized protein TRIADDRAFT_21019 [Trichoplax adhaerens]|uniref:Septin-type G domain-containing protein n=1 Tax=Trichoplax adhaerens TaxID=10228 RepID=B3RMJ1_TRIAD|nr:hypothetical protein TRIADDRAFT_21019 [Trichoplax adhaerens]EDV27855.1 hypothetical protein TRIADDRAFT_21019 [Trichoplax adhaerens]|eukprot:XP_002109689.1 hypothetical protein TRIADDRAFT_21019 [Trichoplax adhaerens]